MFKTRNVLQCLCSIALIAGMTLPCAAQAKKLPPPPPNPGTGNPNPGTGNPGTGNPIPNPNPNPGGVIQPGTGTSANPPRSNNQPSAAAIQQARINDGFTRILTQRAMQSFYNSQAAPWIFGQSNSMATNPMMNQLDPWQMMNPMMNPMNPMMNPMNSMMNPMMNPMNSMMNPMMMNPMNPMNSMMNPMMMNQMNPWAMNPMMNNPMAFQMNPWQMNQPGLFGPGMMNPAMPGLFNNPGVFMRGGF